MKQSYCGLCETCLIDKPDFLMAIAKVKEYLDQFPITRWAHCFPGDEGFSFPELHKGLDWFLSHPECPSCKGGGGLRDYPIRRCAKTREVAKCLECYDLETCEHYNIIIHDSPGQVVRLHRYLLRNTFGRL
jgi:Protein of unknown function (DUF3795)